MENYIVINGKKTELTEEQLEKLGIEAEKTNYEEMFNQKHNERYYWVLGNGEVDFRLDNFSGFDYDYYKVGNYCKNKEVMEQRALHETLNRLLWRASIIAGELDNPWDGKREHWEIYCQCTNNRDFAVTCWRSNKHNVVYFPTKDAAYSAIDNIIQPFLKEHPGFVW